MLNYSFTTVLMAVLTSNFIIVLIALCFQHKNILLSVGYKLLIAFLFLTVVRFAFPFELPVARNVYLPDILSVPLTYFRYPFAHMFGIPISMWVIFQCIWIVGIIYRLHIYVHEHILLLNQLNRYSTDITELEPYATMLAKICGGRRNPFRVLKVHGISTPSIFGIIKPRILIPLEMQLSDTNLYYSLCHETSHYFHRDLWIKFSVSVLSIMYWWNPVCQLFKKQVDMLLEMRVDGSLIRKDSATAREYLDTLVHITEESLRLQTLYEPAYPENLLLSFAKEKDGLLIRRYEMMFNTQGRMTHMPVVVSLIAVIATIYMGSFYITFENTHIIEQQRPSDYVVDEGFFAILKDDGTYDTFYDGFFLENVNSLEYYPEDIVIYSE